MSTCVTAATAGDDGTEEQEGTEAVSDEASIEAWP
jgi:hypothetical protein